MMKARLLGLMLFAATAAIIGLYPSFDSSALTRNLNPLDPPTVTPTKGAINQVKPQIELVFVLDTTGSMGGLIAAAKEKIWSIAATMAQAESAPEIRIGLVAYRDRGDAYVTQVVDLSSDLDSIYAKLMDFAADGGGDGPEAVNQALADAVQRISWSTLENTYKVIFLVGDAPPHMDYANDMHYPEIVKLASRRGITINTIRCGNDESTRQAWQQIASLSQGEFFNVEHNGNAVAVATPFDESIAALSQKMDETRLAFGSDVQQKRHAEKQEATAKLHASASLASRARRAAFNASASGKRNFLGENDLVDAVASGRVDLSALPAATLPEPLRMLPPAERESEVNKRIEDRGELKRKLARLAVQREQFIAKEVAASGGAKASLDEKIYGAVRRQAAGVGLTYGDGAAKY